MASDCDWIIKQILDFEMYDSDCVITGHPKSGTTWLQEIVCLILHGGDPDLCNLIPNYVRVPYLETAESLDFLELQPHPRVFKTHLPFHLLPRQVQEKDCRLICIMRNPKDVAVSMYKFYRHFNADELGKYVESWPEFLETFSNGGDWFDHVLGWWRQRRRTNVLVVQYEDLKNNPRELISKIGVFLNRRLDSKSVDAILRHTCFQRMKENCAVNLGELSTNQESSFMRKGHVGDWRNYFTAEQNELFDQVYRERLGNFGLDFAFD